MRTPRLEEESQPAEHRPLVIVDEDEQPGGIRFGEGAVARGGDAGDRLVNVANRMLAGEGLHLRRRPAVGIVVDHQDRDVRLRLDRCRLLDERRDHLVEISRPPEGEHRDDEAHPVDVRHWSSLPRRSPLAGCAQFVVRATRSSKATVSGTTVAVPLM